MTTAITGAETRLVYPADADNRVGQPGEGAEFGNVLPCDLGTIIDVAQRVGNDVTSEDSISVNPGRYKLVRYDPDATDQHPQTGDVVSYKGNTGFADNVVTGDNSDGNDVGAGVISAFKVDISQSGATQGARTRANETLKAGMYCWIQISGRCTLRNAIGGSPADGGGLEVSDTDFALQAQSGSSTRAQVAIAVDASAKLVSLNFPG